MRIRKIPDARRLLDDQPHPIFPLGGLSWDDDVATVIAAEPAFIQMLFDFGRQHAAGIWSDREEPSERERNIYALANGLPILSCYQIGGRSVYFRTNAKRTETVVTLRER